MKTKFKSSNRAAYHSFGVVCAVAVSLLLGGLASSVQASQYLYTGSETTINLNPGLYNITAYGAHGGDGSGGLGAEMEGQFNFTASTTLTLLVGGSGINGVSGGGGSFVVNGGLPLVIAGGGGGGSIIDSSAIMVLSEVSGVASPNGSPNGEIIINAVPEPTSLALAGLTGLSLLLFRRQRK
jgi:hypothetical protein